jgi:Tfp pilus assembly protein PilO
MKAALKYVDSRLAAVVGVLLVATLLGRVVILAQAENARDTARAEERAAALELEEIELRVDSIRAQGSENLQEVIFKVGVIEQQLPAALDELTLTVAFDTLASSSGVSLTEFSKPKKAGVPELGEILVANAYDFAVTGKYSDVVDFLERVLGAPPFLATFDSISIRIQQAGGNSSGDVDIFSKPVSLTGRVLLWSLADAPVVYGNETPTGPTADGS